MGLRMFNKNCDLHENSETGYHKRSIKIVYADAGINPISPNPINFIILQATQVGKHLVVKINYPDCTNYEGNKICVYLNTKKKEFINRKNLDPHFSTTLDSPFARFKPTQEGWNAAISLLKILR